MKYLTRGEAFRVVVDVVERSVTTYSFGVMFVFATFATSNNKAVEQKAQA